MFLPRLDPQAAAALSATADQERIGRADRRSERAAAWTCAALAVPATAALIVLGFAAAVFWVAAFVVGSLALAYVAGAAVLLRSDSGPMRERRSDGEPPADAADPGHVGRARMTARHTAQIAGISRALGRAAGAELKQLLGRIETRWSELDRRRRAIAFEEGRQRADYPRTAEQDGLIAGLAVVRAEVSEAADELVRISRDLPGRIASLCADPGRGVDPAALQLAMIEARLRLDAVPAT